MIEAIQAVRVEAPDYRIAQAIMGLGSAAHLVVVGDGLVKAERLAQPIERKWLLNVSRNWTLSKGVNVVHGDPNSTHPSDGLTPRMRTYSTPHENLAQAVQGKLLIQISLIENSATTTGVLRGERYWRRRIR